MEPIKEINKIDSGIRYFGIENIGISNNRVTQIKFANIRQLDIPEIESTSDYTNTVIPQAPPVTERVGTPIVNMPGCVKVHKENAKNPASKNKMLVNDDPKQNVVLCDAGMPYYEPPNYDYRELTWQTVYMDQEEEAEGVNTETGDVTAPDTPEPPPAGDNYKDPECPGPLEPRLGSVGPNEKEKVTGYELQPDPNNLNKKICVVLYEDIGVVEQYLPSPQIVTTTAVIASVAASSALLAKPLADLLLRVVKPAVKKVIGKVNSVLGKTPYRPTQEELRTNEYRVKKGLLPIPFAKNHAKKEKARKKEEKKIENQKKESQKKNPQS